MGMGITGFRCDAALREALDDHAAMLGLSRSVVIRQILREVLGVPEPEPPFPACGVADLPAEMLAKMDAYYAWLEQTYGEPAAPRLGLVYNGPTPMGRSSEGGE